MDRLKFEIGSLDAYSWDGIVILGEGFSFGIKFGVFFNGKLVLGGKDQYDLVDDVGTIAPDGSFAHLGWSLSRDHKIVLEWAGNLKKGTLIGKLVYSGKDLPLNLFALVYSPWNRAVFNFKDNVFLGTSNGINFITAFSINPVSVKTYKDFNSFKNRLNLTHQLPEGNGNKMGIAQFRPFNPGTLYFFSAIGKNVTCNFKQIDRELNEKKQAYERKRVISTGVIEGAAQAITQNSYWNKVYARSINCIFPSFDRGSSMDWGADWVVGEYDCFMDALLTSIEDKKVTYEGIYGILKCASKLGHLPNIAAGKVPMQKAMITGQNRHIPPITGKGITPDRSQLPVGSYAVWRIYLKYREIELLKNAYPSLRRWHLWWFSKRKTGKAFRDGNGNGLLELGSEQMGRLWCAGSGGLVFAKGEAGADDSPIFDNAKYIKRTRTMDLDYVGLNSFYALDAEMLSRIAGEIGERKDCMIFSEEYERMKGLINKELWDEKDGIYKNRYWNGSFEDTLTPMDFFPLLAGIPDRERAKRMVRHLTDTEEFWGEYVIPTVWKKSPAFTDQYYWRGSIWGPTNYFVYHGLKRYEFNKIASEIAEKSYHLFMNNWKENNTCNESYLVSGKGTCYKHYTWGALLCLIAIEDLIDFSPWHGLCFGKESIREVTEVKRTVIDGKTYSLRISPDETTLFCNNRRVFHASQPVRMVNFKIG